MRYDTNEYKYWQQFEENHILTNVDELLLKSDVTVTDKIINLQNLSSLKLYGKDINVFPEAFLKHPGINHIKIENTSITSLPEEIWSMTSLETLILENNKSLENFPEIRQNNRVFRNLLINEGNFRTLPNSIDKLENLNSLGCIDISLEKLPDSIVNFKHLEQLVLDNNKLEFLPEKIGNLTTLTVFSANFNKLSFLPQSFYNLVNLRMLFISENPFNAPINYNSFPNLHYTSRDELKALNEKIRQEAPIRGHETASALLDARQKAIPYETSSIPASSIMNDPDLKDLVKKPGFYQLPEDIVETIMRNNLGFAPKLPSNNAKGGRRRTKKMRKGRKRRTMRRRKTRRTNKK